MSNDNKADRSYKIYKLSVERVSVSVSFQLRGLPGALSTNPIVLKGLPGAQGAPTKIALVLSIHTTFCNNHIISITIGFQMS